ncbi:hypothetical protein DAEQUDRAFT_738501 [Daedalea quercina L-15889]|uniref:Uncharacterized protein n=1 Tax=Daedalea quercina L-15889 TaxID=1314783 RepID=A0A165PZD4_9APHY|nr:hypothetical protein DAEQUDRAFT_738501 [Daedalea quercina L-15889]
MCGVAVHESSFCLLPLLVPYPSACESYPSANFSRANQLFFSTAFVGRDKQRDQGESSYTELAAICKCCFFDGSGFGLNTLESAPLALETRSVVTAVTDVLCHFRVPTTLDATEDAAGAPEARLSGLLERPERLRDLTIGPEPQIAPNLLYNIDQRDCLGTFVAFEGDWFTALQKE